MCFRRRLGCAGPARGNKGGPVVAAAPRNQARAFPAASPAVSFLPNLLSFGLASVGAGVRRPRARWLPKSPQPEGCRRGSPRPLCPCPRFASGRAVGRCHRSGISGKQVADRECVTGVYLLWVWFFFFPLLQPWSAETKRLFLHESSYKVRLQRERPSPFSALRRRQI